MRCDRVRVDHLCDTRAIIAVKRVEQSVVIEDRVHNQFQLGREDVRDFLRLRDGLPM